MGALATYRRLLGNRPLTKLLGGEFVSAIGDWLYIVALLVVIYGETGDPVILGLFGAARVVPYILLSVPAGVIADRYDRRLVLLVTDLARGGCMLVMAWIVATDGPILGLVATSILAACFSTFFYPAIGAYIPNLVVDERELGPANSAWASLDNLGFIVGPVLGGLLLATGGVTFAFLINAATFLVIAAVLWTLPPSKNVRPTVPVEAKDSTAAAASSEGAATSDGDPAIPVTAGEQPAPTAGATTDPTRRSLRPLVGITVVRMMSYAVAGGVGILTVVIAIDVLDAGEAATGYLNAAIGIGGVSGAIIAGLLVLRRSLAVPVVVGSVVLAAGAIVLGIAPALFLAMVAVILISAGGLLLDVMTTTLMQRVTSDQVRGRAVGALMTVDTMAEALGALLFPILVTAIGILAVMTASAVLLIAATAVGLVLIGGSITRVASPFEEIVARVAKLPLFAGAPASGLERAMSRLREVPVVAGQAVVTQGEPADRFYIIASGSFVVRQTDGSGQEHELRRLGPDDVFGELGILSEAPRSATVVAETDGEVLALDGPDFLALVSSATSVRGRLLGLYESQESADR